MEHIDKLLRLALAIMSTFIFGYQIGSRSRKEKVAGGILTSVTILFVVLDIILER